MWENSTKSTSLRCPCQSYPKFFDSWQLPCYFSRTIKNVTSCVEDFFGRCGTQFSQEMFVLINEVYTNNVKPFCRNGDQKNSKWITSMFLRSDFVFSDNNEISFYSILIHSTRGVRPYIFCIRKLDYRLWRKKLSHVSKIKPKSYNCLKANRQIGNPSLSDELDHETFFTFILSSSWMRARELEGTSII